MFPYTFVSEMSSVSRTRKVTCDSCGTQTTRSVIGSQKVLLDRLHVCLVPTAQRSIDLKSNVTLPTKLLQQFPEPR